MSKRGNHVRVGDGEVIKVSWVGDIDIVVENDDFSIEKSHSNM